jgi:hypothetical protein
MGEGGGGEAAVGQHDTLWSVGGARVSMPGQGVMIMARAWDGAAVNKAMVFSEWVRLRATHGSRNTHG